MEVEMEPKLTKRFRAQAERNALADMFKTAAAACKPIKFSKAAHKKAPKNRAARRRAGR